MTHKEIGKCHKSNMNNIQRTIEKIKSQQRKKRKRKKRDECRRGKRKRKKRTEHECKFMNVTKNPPSLVSI